MQVILLEKVKNLGNLGEIVHVKPGYARNFLLRLKKAASATASNVKQFEEKRAELEKKAQQLLSQAEQRAAKFNDTSIVITAQASDEGKLFGSIGVNEIKTALNEKSLEVNKREIILTDGPFHSVGDYEVEIHVHADVIATLQIQIVSTK